MDITEAKDGSWYATVTNQDLAPGSQLPKELEFLANGRGVWSVDVVDKNFGKTATLDEILTAAKERIPWADFAKVKLHSFPKDSFQMM